MNRREVNCDGRLVCKYCDESYLYEHILAHHENTVHGDSLSDYEMREAVFVLKRPRTVTMAGTTQGSVPVVDNRTPLNDLSFEIHQANVKAGWWTDLETGLPKERNVGELLCLVHSEISEAMEGHRKNLKDDKLPHRSMFEVELADALIRIFDIAGKFKLDLDGAVREKREFNAKRSDHKIENRLKDTGKKY